MGKNKSEVLGVPAIIDPIKELITDSLEVIVDTRLDEGILKDLPVTGSLIKVYKAFTGIKDLIFLRKLSRFFTELDTIPIESRTDFWTKYEDEEEEKKKLGEQLIIYLERHDTIDKSIFLARAFGAYVKGHILKTDFLDLAVLIDSLQVHHLETITSILILAGEAHSFYRELSLAYEWNKFIPEMEIQRFLEYKDETKIVEGRYEYLEGSSIKITRQHRITPLAEQFLNYVVYEFSNEVADKMKNFQNEAYLFRQKRITKRNEESNKINT